MADSSLAFFVSPHGFGHAARSSAIIQALHRMAPSTDIHIFTRAPRWFFDASLTMPYSYHDCLTDIGLVQSTPLEEDLAATLQQLSAYLPFPQALLQEIAGELHRLHCQAVICDISPLGIAAARAAGLPSILVENFTWDWIYAGYLEHAAGFMPFIQQFHSIFQTATSHIQTRPFCVPSPSADLITHPIARPARVSRAAIREQLHIPQDARTVLLTMGGFQINYEFLERVSLDHEAWFIVPGGTDELINRHNLALIPHHSSFYHPDLVNASDAVISKAGYSTISEVFYAGIPYGYVSRDEFRESPVLSEFVRREMAGLEIDGATFQTGSWVAKVPELLSLPRIQRDLPWGADQAAGFIYETYLRPSR